jgi:uncharacterized membrane protein HdeD (DUF308 family)
MPERNDSGDGSVGLLLATSWQSGLLVGVITLALGIIVAANPSTSINVVSVLVGILLIFSGILQLVRALDTSVVHRAWSAIVGLGFIVLGVVLVRHLDVTRALIALLVGITWIAQGVIELMVAATERDRAGRGWAIVYGLVSLAAGIVVVAVPVGSLNALAVLLGIWFIIIGILDIVGAFLLRHVQKRAT